MKTSNDTSGSKQVRWLANFLDTKFKIGPLRFGWDSIIGLIPGVGDTATSIASTFIIYQAYNHGMSSSTLARMTLNVLIDNLVGSVPLLGDFVDIFWRSNQRNAALFERELQRPTKGKALSTIWLVFFSLLILVSLGLAIYLPLKLLAIMVASVQ